MALEIQKMLVLSTSHVSEHTSELLDCEFATAEWIGLAVFNKAHVLDQYGWHIYIDNVLFNADARMQIPEDLLRCIDLALENNCSVLCLDRDGPTVEELPEFDW